MIYSSCDCLGLLNITPHNNKGSTRICGFGVESVFSPSVRGVAECLLVTQGTLIPFSTLPPPPAVVTEDPSLRITQGTSHVRKCRLYIHLRNRIEISYNCPLHQVDETSNDQTRLGSEWSDGLRRRHCVRRHSHAMCGARRRPSPSAHLGGAIQQEPETAC